MNIPSFDSFGLEIDYLSFNLNSQDMTQVQKIADYLAKNFKCQSSIRNSKTNSKKTLTDVSKPYFSAQFVQEEVEFWKGTSIRVSGKQAAKFYKLISQNPLDSDIFDLNSISLGRIDIKYDYKITSKDSSILSFLEETHRLQDKKRTAKIDYNQQLLTIWKRKNAPQYYRVYLLKNGKELRFELELKLEKAKAYQHSLFQGAFQEFEHGLIYIFTKATTRIFDINHPYLAWMKDQFRIIRQLKIRNEDSRLTTYMIEELIYQNSDLVDVHRFLQLLNFIHSLSYQNEFLGFGKVCYRSYKFTLSNFLEFLGEPKTNFYQLKKLRQFFEIFQEKKKIILPTFIQYFSETEFRRIAVLPVINIQKTSKTWEVILTVSEKFFHYVYPFYFSAEFFQYKNKHELRAQIFLLQASTQRNLEKRLMTEEFFSKIPVNKNNQGKLKKHLVYLFQELQNSKFIDPTITVVTKTGKEKRVTKLTSNLISRSKYIDFQENRGI